MTSAPVRDAKQPNRLSSGGLINRSRVLNFQFDGENYAGCAGDTLASALLASGVRLVGRSFKYHRPRGIFTAGSEEPNALVELRTGARREPNSKATTIELFEGLQARSQNRWPSLRFDVGAINSLLSPLFVAGFYYKTFMWPRAFWEKLYEPAIRRAAGLGKASIEPDPDRYEKAHAFCDLLVIGAGPAGLAAALTAGRAGARVILCDEDFVLGGRLNSDRREIDGTNGSLWARQVEAELRALPEVRVLNRTSVFGVFDGGTYGALERVADHLPVPLAHLPRQRLWKIVAKHSVLAAGAIERPIVFGGNDRPGVMMGSAVRTYVNRFGVAPGRQVVIFTATDDGWNTAFDMEAAGVQVRAVVDARKNVTSSVLTEANKRLRAELFLGSTVIDTQGMHGLRKITIRHATGQLVRLECDLLAVSGGWNPTLALSTHLGGRPRWSDDIAAFVPGTLPREMRVVGAARGSWRLADALTEGIAAGTEAARSSGYRVSAIPSPRTDDEGTAAAAFWHVADSKGKAFVDLQHDVTAPDIALATREGYRSVELLKRYTTLGMATDQGKTSNVNGLAILASLTERAIPDVGTTVFRPPYTPVAIAAFVGHHRGKHFRPTRLTSGHAWAQERGATFVEAGQWLRAQWFAQPGETDWLQSVTREVKAVRSSVGVCDVSTLGKIDVQGADAGIVLDRLYANTFSTLPVGKVRYGLMLREDGIVFDDGTAARLAEGHYVVSTTTANAAKVMQHMEHARQVLWPELDVQIVSVTEQWAQYAIAGPNSRRLLQRLLGDSLDVSNTAFPYLACAELSWRGIPCRLFRISFSGELAYELAVPARYGDATIRAILAAGAEWDVVPYGTEALAVMRIEKGHVAGNELNGQTTATDLGLGRMVSGKKDHIGGVLARREGLTSPQRPSLVGVKPVDRSARLHGGAHFFSKGAAIDPQNDRGYLTSVAMSPTLGHWIGLGFLSGGAQCWGEHVRAYDPVRGIDLILEVCSPVFFDPQGLRLNN
ncbi:MAG TPA: sarcosine oxidase subunit alpha family protein [Steroidobacter sp.]|uniref:sarcosine oxidase subunit alpha family protein n=1 Tax=Steroidobacter sp. TaxID=1978227 RepID=UPI002ED9CD74